MNKKRFKTGLSLTNRNKKPPGRTSGLRVERAIDKAKRDGRSAPKAYRGRFAWTRSKAPATCLASMNMVGMLPL